MDSPEAAGQQEQPLQEEQEEQVEYDNENEELNQPADLNAANDVSDQEMQDVNQQQQEQNQEENTNEELNGNEEDKPADQQQQQQMDVVDVTSDQNDDAEFNREDRVEHDEDQEDLDGDGEPSTKRQRLIDSHDIEDLSSKEEDRRSDEDDDDDDEDCSHIEIGTDDPMKMPPHGTEVFMGGIPHDASDEEILDFCKGVGKVFKTHIPRDPKLTEQNKGYAFIMFFTQKEARRAIAKLNNKEFANHADKKVRVSWSQQRNKLFLGNIPKHYTQDMVMADVQPECKGINNVELVASKEIPGENRGFCFIEFYNAEAANQARIALGSPTFKMGGRQITVTWAEPKKTDSETERVRSVYVGNLPDNITEDMLREVFVKYGEIEKIVLPTSKEEPGRLRDYGFVHFTERSSAMKAVDAQGVDKPMADGKELKVAMARLPSNADRGGGGGGMFDNAGRMGARGGGLRSMVARRGPMGAYGGSFGDYGDTYYDADFRQDEVGGMYDQYTMDYSAYYGQAGGQVMVPMMLPNGQVAYMVQPGAVTGAAMPQQDMSGNRSGSRGGDRSFSRNNNYGGYGGYDGDRGGGGGGNDSRGGYDNDDYGRSRRSRSGSGGYQSRGPPPSRNGGGSSGGGGGGSSRYRPY